MKYVRKLAVTTAMIVSSGFVLYGQGDPGLIIPMPGQKQIEKAKEELKKPDPAKPQDKPEKSGTLIPLPKKIKPLPKKPDPTNAIEPAKPDEVKPLIVMPSRPKPEPTPDSSSDEFPQIPDEVVIEPDSLTPPVSLPDSDPTSVAVSNDDPASLPVFPKDTSSAVFMVMKTWQCKDYDGNTLLSHAVEVYSQEAGESFSIKGLSDDQGFKLDLDEEDITLDELLDLIALKTGRDWGADITSRTIFFYPKGFKTDGLTGW